jgi:hydrogenase expression/formation protein HypE
MSLIQLNQGGGSQETQRLIQQLFFRYFNDPILTQAEDAAHWIGQGDMAFSTDSYTVNPLFFAGGDIGKLAVFGTLNDLAMRGARPAFLSAGFIIEEGLPLSTLERVVQSMAQALTTSSARLICGDTKVVPKGAVDQLFINTSAIGTMQLKPIPGMNRIQPNDALILSGDIGRHGAVVMAQREDLLLKDVVSDCGLLWPEVAGLISEGIELHALRDATRGGLAGVLNEWAQATGLLLQIDEASLPVNPAVKGLCELLGFEPTDLANEGRMVIALPKSQVNAALDVLQAMPSSQQACQIGEVLTPNSSLRASKVVMRTAWGTERWLDWPKGELLPRIC